MVNTPKNKMITKSGLSILIVACFVYAISICAAIENVTGQFIATEKLFCAISESTLPNEQQEVFNYNCSNRGLNWFSLPLLIDHIRASTSLNLASNLLGSHLPHVRNLTFNLFKQLKRLNLSSNALETAESHAFFYIDKITDSLDTTYLRFLDPSQLKPLHLNVLDLSHNRFERLPWASLHSLPDLTVLDLSANPIKAFDLGDWTPPNRTSTESSHLAYENYGYDEMPVVKHLIIFENLSEIYLQCAQIDRVDAQIFTYLTRLRVLDLTGNRIRHLSGVELKPRLDELQLFQHLYLARNPLVCDCRLIWLKEFLAAKQKLDYDKSIDRNTMCLINTKANKKNLLVETKVIYINSTYKTNENYFKLTSINHLNSETPRARSIYAANMNRTSATIGNVKEIRIWDLDENEFYCDLDLTGQVKDLTLLNERSHYRQEIEITCRVHSYPEAKIKWVFGQRDLDKMFMSYENIQFNVDDKRQYNATEHLYTVDSRLLVSYSGHIGKVNFSCRAFHLNVLATASPPPAMAQPTHLLKMILFNINSDDDERARVLGDDQDEYTVNSTVLMIKEAMSNDKIGERPLIYWVLLSLCVLFALTVVVFLLVCMVRQARKKRRKQRDTDVSNYAYSTYTTSNYSTINKRSAIYLNSTHHHGTTKSGVSGVTNALASSSTSSAMLPLKPDVIREHKEQSSCYYYRMSSHSSTPQPHLSSAILQPLPTPHDYSTPYAVVTSANHSKQSFDRTPVEVTVTTPSTTEESVSVSSSSNSSKRDSTRSSKSFEENIDEYLEPEGPDLSKPPPKQSHKLAI